MNLAIEVILLILLPIGSIVLVTDRFLAKREEETWLRLEHRLERHLQIALYRSQPIEVLATYFRKVWNRFSHVNFSPEAIIRLPTFPMPEFDLRVIGFTPKEESAIPSWSGSSNKAILQKFWHCLLSNNWPISEQRMFKRLFGSMFKPINLLKSQKLPYDIFPQKKPGKLFWDVSSNHSGLVVFSPSLPRIFFPLRFLLSQDHRESDGFWAIYDTQLHRSSTHGIPWESWKTALRKCALQERRTFLIDGFLCQAVHHPQGLWIMRAFPASYAAGDPLRSHVWFMGLLGVIFMGLPLTKSNRLGFWYWSLPKKLFFLFSIAFITTGTTLILLSLGNFREQTQVAEQEFRDQALARLREVDRQFQAYQEVVLDFFRALRDNPIIREGNPPKIADLVRDLYERKQLTQFEIRKIDSSLIATFNVSPGRLKTTELFSREVLRRYLGSIQPSKDMYLDATVKNIMQSPFLGFKPMFDRPDSLIPLSAVDEFEKTFWYWDVFPSTSQQPVSFISLSLNLKDMLSAFLKKIHLGTVFVYDHHLRVWSQTTPLESFFNAIVAQAHIGRRVAHTTFRKNGKEYLASAYPSNLIYHYCYLTLTDLEPIHQHIGAMQTFMGIGAFLLGLMVWIFSQVLSQAILKPVKKLVIGLEALEKRRFDYRLESLGTDEFGELSDMFNMMMTEFKDLDVGREIQTRLLPRSLPIIPGYETVFTYQSNSELGGDYVDILPLSGGRYLFLLADVTGHGVSAALVTAMAKAIAFTSAKSDHQLPELFARFDALIKLVVKRAKMMTIVGGILDPFSHSIEILSAGHPFPFILRRNNVLEEISFKNPMLGAKWAKSWTPCTILLEPGETLMLYSDGLYEAYNILGKPFDFDRVMKTFQQCGGKKPKIIAENILLAQKNFLGGVMPQDDVTMFFLQRNP
ncbi:MAG: SpoIIE family protein phosphatase [Candidatus Riflebacteria bacterium]|nr:SpoIIE family protein phosphatase [Candidatus Riflebacteria bacterium]